MKASQAGVGEIKIPQDYQKKPKVPAEKQTKSKTKSKKTRNYLRRR